MAIIGCPLLQFQTARHRRTNDLGADAAIPFSRGTGGAAEWQEPADRRFRPHPVMEVLGRFACNLVKKLNFTLA
jgi:hypothetical protein